MCGVGKSECEKKIVINWKKSVVVVCVIGYCVFVVVVHHMRTVSLTWFGSLFDASSITSAEFFLEINFPKINKKLKMQPGRFSWTVCFRKL
jgi:hypothetical protein